MKTRLEPSVLWREGMFLLPQHLQAYNRELAARIQGGDVVGRVGDYGLLALEVQVEALERDVFQPDRIEALFRDGTLAVFPDTASVEPREFIEHFSGPELTVWLGIPAAQTNVPQVGDDNGRAYRFRVDVQDVADENLRDANRQIEFRHLVGRLFFGSEDRSGFECIPIAKLVREGAPVAHSVLSADYMPPSLAVGASRVLLEALQYTAERVRSQARDLAARLPAMSAQGDADLTGIFKLQALNQGLVGLEQAAGTPRLHPYDAFQALISLAGSLSVFGAERVAPQLPIYDHDRMSESFDAALGAVHGLLVAEVSVPYDVTEFSPDAVREGFFEVDIPQTWIDAGATFYLAVEMEKAPEEVAELVVTGLKLLAPDDVDRVLQGVLPGIELEHKRIAPVSFPSSPTLHFFQVVSEGASRDAWLSALQARRALILSALAALGDVRFHFFVELPG